ncbi:MAG: formate-nitrite transporter family protein [Blastocatellia bacterium]|jgi:protein-disulfide isomerase|nr:formate-nitrite transporter family protein [Blastocatellia bacterium]
MRRYLPFAIIGAVLALAVASVLVFTRSAKNSNGSQFSTPPPATSTSENSSPTTNQTASGASPYAPLGASAPGAQPPHVRGAANAKITLEEFGDYQCPPCRALFSELKKIESEYHDRLRLIFRHYPITEKHKHALVAAHAAEAAGLQNKYWEMHDRLYETQTDWAEADNAREIFIKYARELGLDVERFVRDLDNNDADVRIAADRQRAQALGVLGTPTLFVNGRQLKPEAMTPEMMRKAIDFMLDPRNQ